MEGQQWSIMLYSRFLSSMILKFGSHWILVNSFTRAFLRLQTAIQRNKKIWKKKTSYRISRLHSDIFEQWRGFVKSAIITIKDWTDTKNAIISTIHSLCFYAKKKLISMLRCFCAICSWDVSIRRSLSLSVGNSIYYSILHLFMVWPLRMFNLK